MNEMQKAAYEMRSAMKMIEKVDSLPKNETIVVHTKGRLTPAQYEQLIGALKHVREDSELGQVLVVPYEDMEIRQLEPRDKERLLKLLGVDMDAIDYVLNTMENIVQDPSAFDYYNSIEQMQGLLSKAVGYNNKSTE